jgi:hypothetical protein
VGYLNLSYIQNPAYAKFKYNLMRRFNHLLFICLLSFISLTTLGQEKKALTLEDYKEWNRIANTAMSPDGLWMTYSYSPNEGDATFFIRELAGDTVYSALNARAVNFSNNSEWVAFLVNPSKAEAEKLRKQKQPVTADLHLYNLTTKTATPFEDVSSYAFSESSNMIAIQKVKKDRDAKHEGTDLILKSLSGETVLNTGNVSNYGFNESGSHFAYLVDADGQTGNGVYVIDLMAMSTKSLHTSANTYSQLSWNEEGSALAAFFGSKVDTLMQRDNTLLWATSLGLGTQAQVKTFETVPAGYVISEYRPITWNEAGTQLYFGIKAQEEVLKKKDELEANVDVWHWKDEVVQSRQMITAGQDRRATHLSVLNLTNKAFHQLQTDDMAFVRTNDKSKWAVASVDKPYRVMRDRPSGYADLYALNTETGQRQLIAEEVYHNLGISPMGICHVLKRRSGILICF